MTYYGRFIVLCAFWFFYNSNYSFSQAGKLSLDSCFILARNNYPQIKQLHLLVKTGETTVSNLNKAYLPQFSFNAQATYQSDVTSLPISIPGFPSPEPLNKDQYKFYADMTQIVYDGGTIQLQKKLARANAKLEISKVETELYKLNERILQLYFGILISQYNLQSLDLLEKDLVEQINKATVALNAKAIAANTLYLIQAEKLKLDQRRIELNTYKGQLIQILGVFINRNLGSTAELLEPPIPSLSPVIQRPELQLVDQQIYLANLQWKLSRTKSIPRVNLFGQVGYSNPALNFLKNEFQTYYIGGIRLNWNFSALYQYKGDHRMSVLNKNLAELQRESFLFNTQLNLMQQNQDIQKYVQLIKSDKDLIELRIKIKNASKSQYENGLITTSDYLHELNAEEQARTTEFVHRLQFLQAQYLFYYYSGINL